MHQQKGNEFDPDEISQIIRKYVMYILNSKYADMITEDYEELTEDGYSGNV